MGVVCVGTRYVRRLDQLPVSVFVFVLFVFWIPFCLSLSGFNVISLSFFPFILPNIYLTPCGPQSI